MMVTPNLRHQIAEEADKNCIIGETYPIDFSSQFLWSYGLGDIYTYIWLDILRTYLHCC